MVSKKQPIKVPRFGREVEKQVEKNQIKSGRLNYENRIPQVVTEHLEDETGMVIIVRKPSLKPFFEEIKKRKPTKKFSVVIQPEFYDMIPSPKAVFIREAIIEKLGRET